MADPSKTDEPGNPVGMDTDIFLRKEGYKFQPKRKIIKARDYMVYMETNEILDRAKNEAAHIIDESKKVYEAEKKKGYEDGFIEGKMHISQQIVDTVNKTVDYFSKVEEKLINIVIFALKKIFGEIGDKELILKVVRNALNAVRNQKHVTLRVAPSQVDTVNERLSEILENYPMIQFIDVVPEARLDKGGCILESEIGVVDASVDIQLESIEKSLAKSFKGSK